LLNTLNTSSLSECFTKCADHRSQKSVETMNTLAFAKGGRWGPMEDPPRLLLQAFPTSALLVSSARQALVSRPSCALHGGRGISSLYLPSASSTALH
jgi:hypothetical protein